MPAAAFQAAFRPTPANRLKGGCGHDCPPYDTVSSTPLGLGFPRQPRTQFCKADM